QHVLRYFLLYSGRLHTRSYGDCSSDVCSSDLLIHAEVARARGDRGRAEVRVGVPVARRIGRAEQIVGVQVRAERARRRRVVIKRSEERRVGKGGGGRWGAVGGRKRGAGVGRRG